MRTRVAFNKQNSNDFNMLLQKLAWQNDAGWSASLPAGMDSPTTLAVMFGGNPFDGFRDAIDEA